MRKGSAWAKVVCAVLGLVAVTAMAAVAALETAKVRGWAEALVQRALAERGVDASFRLALGIAPLRAELHDVRFSWAQGTGSARRVIVTPRVLTLLSRRIAIDAIELDEPALSASIDPEAVGATGAPGRLVAARVRAVVVRDGSIDARVGTIAGSARGIDMQARVARDAHGVAYDATVRVRGARVDHFDARGDAAWGDVLCDLRARGRVASDAIEIASLRAAGVANADSAAGSAYACAAAPDDPRRVALEVDDARAWTDGAGRVGAHGHARARAPLGLIERFSQVAPLAGWATIDADAYLAPGARMPEAHGTVEVHELTVGRFAIARTLNADLDVAVAREVVRVRHASAEAFGGVVSIDGAEVRPFVPRAPLRVKSIEGDGVTMRALLADLGVTRHPHVDWEFVRLRALDFGGTLSPLALGASLSARTGAFTVYDAACDLRPCARIIGTGPADIDGRLAIDARAFRMLLANVSFDGGQAHDARVSLGFDDSLRVDVPDVDVDLAAVSPLTKLALAGRARVKLHIGHTMSDAVVDAKVRIGDFVLDGDPLGDVDSAAVHFRRTVVDVRNLHARKRATAYEVPSLRLAFGGAASVTVDAVVSADRGGRLRDVLSLVRIDERPGWNGVDATIDDARAAVHFASGGAEDTCGGGVVVVRGQAQVRALEAAGEHADEASLDADVRWFDRRAGLAGADVVLRALSLRDRAQGAGTEVASALVSGRIDGGLVDLDASARLPLSRVAALSPLRGEVDGAASALARVVGPLNAPSFSTDLDLGPTRVRGATFGPSRVHVEGALGDASRDRPRPPCPRAPPEVSRAAHLALSGDLFGGRAHVDTLTLDAAPDPVVRGAITLRDLDLDRVARVVLAREARSGIELPPAAVTGALSGVLVVDRLPLRDPAAAVASLRPSALTLRVAGGRSELVPTSAFASLADRTLTIPPWLFRTQIGDAPPTDVAVRATLADIGRAPTIDLELVAPPMNLGALVGLVPGLRAASGELEGALAARGPLAEPLLRGAIHVRHGALDVRGLPAQLRDVVIDVELDRHEARLVRADAGFADGAVHATGFVPVVGASLGLARLALEARGLRLHSPSGIALTLDADTLVGIDPRRLSAGQPDAVRVTGEMHVDSFAYTRPSGVPTDLTALGERFARPRPRAVETYDPSLDRVSLALRVRPRAPLRLANDILDVQLVPGDRPLLLYGTNQRLGLTGELHALPGGHLRLRSTEFDVQKAIFTFEDPTRIAPIIDIVASTEYRRYSDIATPGGAVGAGAGGTGGTSVWRVALHAFGPADDVRVSFTSEPPLAQDDIVLLLTLGLTRTELAELQAVGAGLEALAAVGGAGRIVSGIVPVDDFRFGSEWSSHLLRVQPNVTLGKRISRDVGATLTAGLGEERDLRTNIAWRLSRTFSLEGSYENVTGASFTPVGNVGVGFRWHLELR
jgi:translocation and assembly module TamB